jgi:hypothetical protein
MWGFMTLHPLELEGRRTQADPADAGHWVTVYDELIRICRECVGDREPTPQVARRLSEFEQRRDFWRGLLRE